MMTELIHRDLLKNIPCQLNILRSLLEKNGPLPLPNKSDIDLFTFLSRTIVGQQLSKSAANSIWNRIIESSTPNLPIQKLLSGDHNLEIKACGVSKHKVKALNCLYTYFEENPSAEISLMASSNTEIVSEITKIWGLGQWSAEMALIFFFNREDVWARDDAALFKGMRVLTRNDGISHDEISSIVNNFSPFKSYLALHIWRGIDLKYI